MGNTGRKIMWAIASVLAIPTFLVSLLIAQWLEDEVYDEG